MQNIYSLCLFTLLLSMATASSADVYKWTDEDGQVHYTQQPPTGREVQEIKAPPPPTIDPRDAQKQIDDLIKQQEKQDRERTFEKALEKQKQQQIENDEKRCETAKSNLQKYQNNPARKLLNKDGTVSVLTEEERQQRITSMKEKVKVYCN